MAGNPKIYGQLVKILGKYSKFASAGEKAQVRQAATGQDLADSAPPSAAPDTDTDPV